MEDLKTVCLITFFILSSSGKKDGEGGILFDNEGEKEQWEEDQKVSGTAKLSPHSDCQLLYIWW